MIGVAISTHRRPQILAQALTGWAQHLARASILVVNHDINGDGVAATKNAGLAALMDAGCAHLFLADDDIWPITPGWSEPYVTNSQPHLMHCWGRARFVCADKETGTTVWTWPRGVLLYTERRVIEKVGGMRTEFGRWGGEHAEWAQRIYNAGFTRAPFADAVAARTGVWHAEDVTRATPSSVPKSVRDDPVRVAKRHALYRRYRDSTEYVEFRS